MSRFSRSEAESNGWVIVHENESQELYRAERYIDGVKVEASGRTEGLLLEAISAYEAHLGSIEPAVPAPVNEAGVPLDEADFPLRSVLAPDDTALTDAEWSQRGEGDVIVDEEGRHQYGPTEAASEADARRQEIAADKENLLKAEPDVGPVERLDQESLRDRQLQDSLVVREGEESLDEVIDRKLEESANTESDRAAAGLGIGPPQFEMRGDELVQVPLGGEPSEFNPSDLPAGVDSAEQGVEVRQEAEVAKAEELRDEHGKLADKPENAAQVAEAGSEAQQDAKDEAEEQQDSSSAEDAEAADDGSDQPAPAASQESPQEGDVDATESAVELAQEKGVDLSNVKGSGKGGRVTKPDVESHLEAQDSE